MKKIIGILIVSMLVSLCLIPSINAEPIIETEYYEDVFLNIIGRFNEATTPIDWYMESRFAPIILPETGYMDYCNITIYESRWHTYVTVVTPENGTVIHYVSYHLDLEMKNVRMSFMAGYFFPSIFSNIFPPFILFSPFLYTILGWETPSKFRYKI